MPDTRLILHVKGTEAETAELHRDAVREGISHGKITHSQLIWRPEENAWKPVRELPELLPIERLILHVKGTDSETREMPKPAVRKAIAEGTLSHSQLIWRPAENTWKSVRELPELLPSQKLMAAPLPKPAAVAPTAMDSQPVVPDSPDSPVARAAASSANLPRMATNVVPQVKGPVPKIASQPVAKIASQPVAVKARASGPVTIAAVSAGGVAPAPSKPVASAPILVRTTGDLEVAEEGGMHFFKWVFLILGLLIAGVIGANYFLVDQPLVANLKETVYGDLTVYAHLGGFIQPNVIVIHIPNSATINEGNLTKYLVELAKSTPKNPVTHELFSRVAITSGWTAQYSFSGYSWNQLAVMLKETDDQRKDFILDELGDAAGQPLIPESKLSEAIQKTRRDKVWNDFVATFCAKP